MPKKTTKVAALVVCVALLALSVPTLNAKPRADKFNLNHFIKKQIVRITSMLSVLPFIDQESDKAPEVKTDIKEKLKITGDLESGRPSGGD